MAHDKIFRIDFYPQEWIVGTGKLTLEQRGLFIQICAMIYANRGPIECDYSWISRASNCSARLAKTVIEQLVQMGFIQQISTEHGVKLSQRRCEHELNTKRTLIESGANGGRKSAENKAKSLENSDLASSETQKPLPSSTLPYPTLPQPKLEKEKIIKKKKPKPAELAEAEWWPHFWEAYPRKEDETDALKKWRIAVNSGQDPENLVLCVENYAKREAEKKTQVQYLKSAKNWLEGKCWKNEQDAVDAAKFKWTENDQWKVRAKLFYEHGVWAEDVFGAKPGHPACMCPPEILAQFQNGAAA